MINDSKSLSTEKEELNQMNNESVTFESITIQIPTPIYMFLKDLCQVAEMTVEDYIQEEINMDLKGLPEGSFNIQLEALQERARRVVKEAGWLEKYE